MVGPHTYTPQVDALATAKLAEREGGGTGAQELLLAYRAHVPLRDLTSQGLSHCLSTVLWLAALGHEVTMDHFVYVPFHQP